MSKKVNKDKSNLANLFLSTIENDSADQDIAKMFLSSEGLDVDRIISDGMKRIKKMEMEIAAEKTEQEMNAANSVKEEAILWVDGLLKSIDFSFPKIVQQEDLSVSFRNVENLSQEDIRNILIKHFTLKFMKK